MFYFLGQVNGERIYHCRFYDECFADLGINLSNFSGLVKVSGHFGKVST